LGYKHFRILGVRSQEEERRKKKKAWVSHYQLPITNYP